MKKKSARGFALPLVLVVVVVGVVVAGTVAYFQLKPKSIPQSTQTITEPTPPPTPPQTTLLPPQATSPAQEDETGDLSGYYKTVVTTCGNLQTTRYTIKCPPDWKIKYTYDTRPNAALLSYYNSKDTHEFSLEEVEIIQGTVSADGSCINLCTSIRISRLCGMCYEWNTPSKEVLVFINGVSLNAFESYSEQSGIKRKDWLLGTADLNLETNFSVYRQPPPSDSERQQILDILASFKWVG